MSREANFHLLKNIAQSNLLSGYLEYANDRTLLTFICNSCNGPYKTTAHQYKSSTRICNTCESNNNRTTHFQQIVNRAKEIHGEYYSYISIINQDLVMICPKHGAITVSIEDHCDNMKGCSHCLVENVTSSGTSAQTRFIEQANQVHKFKYVYNTVKFVSDDIDVVIKCPKHTTFSRTPKQHLSGLGCNICDAKASTINEVIEMLQRNNIAFSQEKTFPDCNSETGRALHFDIFIPEKNLCIEFDSVHHYQPTKYSENVTDEQADRYYEIQVQNDNIKHLYCTQHNINFIRIPYLEYHSSAVIEKYLSSIKDERMIYSWDNFAHDIRCIINYIKTFNYSKFAVYGVSRGGVPFAVHISNHFEGSCQYGCIGFQRYDGNDKHVKHIINHDDASIPIFVIDDLISSGITMCKVTEALSIKYPLATIHPIVLFGAANEHNITYINVHPKKWIVFPYEI